MQLRFGGMPLLVRVVEVSGMDGRRCKSHGREDVRCDRGFSWFVLSLSCGV